MTLSASQLSAISVKLKDLDIAPENPRYREGPDAEIPSLAATLAPDGAGLLLPLLVRAGGKKEKPFMALDGRRRLLAFRHLLDQGIVDEDLEISCHLCDNHTTMAAAAITANQARLPLKPGEIVLAIRTMVQKKMPLDAIAGALCVDITEARKYHAVSKAHLDVLLAYKDKLFDLDTLKLIARMPSMPEQKEMARLAREQGQLRAYQVREYLRSEGIPSTGSMMQLVGLDAYLAAGGRTASDLFEEMPDMCLDTEIAARLWSERVEAIKTAFEERGLSVFVSADEDGYQPDGYVDAPVRYNRPVDEKDALAIAQTTFNAARDDVNAAAEAIGVSAEIFMPILAPHHELAIAKFAPLPVRALQIRPGRQTVLEFRFYTTSDDIREWEAQKAALVTVEPEKPGREADVVPERQVAVETAHGGAFHQHASELAVRGFQRSLADSFSASFKLLLATMFEQVVLQKAGGTSEDRALKVTFARNIGAWYQAPVDGLDADLFARLEAYREAFTASQMRTYPWITSLSFQQLQDLLALMTAVSVWLNEFDAKAIRRTARAQIQEVAEEIGHDIRTHWLPGADFYGRCSKKQLLGYAERMGCVMEGMDSLKKAPLVELVAEQGASRQWIPSVLGFENADTTVEADPGEPVSEDGGDEPGVEAAGETDGAPEETDDEEALAA
jgi:ParB family chromosome partitioning protein